MNQFSINIPTNSKGCYLSSEQIDLLTIVQCNDWNDIDVFLKGNSNVFYTSAEKEKLMELCESGGIEQVKRKIFEDYKDSFVPYKSSREDDLRNRFKHYGISDVNIEYIMENIFKNNPNFYNDLKTYLMAEYPDDYDTMFKLNLHFMSLERDNIKSVTYDEIEYLNYNLANFDTILVGSGKLCHVYNQFTNPKFDFYLAEKDIEFARRNGKKVRYHTLLDKFIPQSTLKGKSKEEVIALLKEFIHKSTDFINRNKDVITAVDLFNEIISFDKIPSKRNPKDTTPKYRNIWYEEYGITAEELAEIYDYAVKNKSKRISYLYNEPFLEDRERRYKVIEEFLAIARENPGIVDTIGTQTHITTNISDEELQDCFDNLKQLSDLGYKVQITEFDLSISRDTIKEYYAKNNEMYPQELATQEKQRVLEKLEEAINNAGFEPNKLTGISYWSILDKMDHNLERTMDELRKQGISEELIQQLTTVYGGYLESSDLEAIKEFNELMKQNERRLKI